MTHTLPIVERPRTPEERRAVEEELERVLGSDLFRRTPGLSGLLRYLVTQELAGAGDSLKETYVAHTFYGRDADYDPKVDALVRVSANRLRFRLQQYYADQQAPGMQIALPRGSYVPRYAWEGDGEAPPSPVATEIETEAGGAGTGPPEVEEVATAEPAVWGRMLPRTADVPDGRWWLFAVLATVVVALCGTVLARWLSEGRPPWFARRSAMATVPWSARPFTRLAGTQVFPDFSRDGQTLLFAWSKEEGNGRSALYVKDIRSGALTQLTDETGESTRAVWSPKGDSVAFVWLGDGRKELRVLSVGSHKVRTVARLWGAYPWLCEVSRISWTADGRWLVTTDSASPDQPCRITLIDVQTGNRQVVASARDGIGSDVEPAVSPDGTRIAFLRNTGALVGDLYTTTLQGDDLRRVTRDGRDILGFAWEPDSRGFVYASRRADGVLRLWRTGVEGGPPERLTDGTAEVGFPTISPDGKAIAVSVYHNVTNIWRVWTGGEPPERLIAGQESNGDPQTSPDGRKVVFRSDRTGATELWTSDRNGDDARQLTYFRGPAANRPAWSPNGREIAFECRDRGHVDVCTIGEQGGTAVHRTEWTSNQERPAWSRDGRALFFISDHSGQREVYRLGQGETEPKQVTDTGALRVLPMWDAAGLLVGRDGSMPGVFCVPAMGGTGMPGAGCAGGRPVVALTGDAVLDRWDAAPGAVWMVEPAAEGASSTALRRVELRSGRSSEIARFPHRIVSGDRALAVEPSGRSALVVEQGMDYANLDLLTKMPATTER